MSSLMIVDDSPTMRKITQRNIRVSGLNFDWIDEADSGEEAFEKLRRHPVDILLCKTERMYKHSEPQATALSILESLRETFPDTKFVTMIKEQRVCAEIIDCWMSAGAKGNITIPTTPKDLQETLSSLMR